jgi:hypothetical protein
MARDRWLLIELIAEEISRRVISRESIMAAADATEEEEHL